MTLQTDPQYKLRLPPELKEKIVASSKEHNRSMNADIVARLEETFKPVNPSSLGLTSEQLEQLAAQAGKAYMLVIANKIKDLPEEEGNRQLRNLIKEISS